MKNYRLPLTRAALTTRECPGTKPQQQTKPDQAEAKAALRHAAEAQIKRKLATQPPQPEADQRHLLQELEIHQVELEMQNEELRTSQAEFKAALEQSSDVFDFAPVGYFSLAADGAIGLLNHAGASLVGLECDELKGRPLQVFLTEPDQPGFDALLQRVFRTRTRQAGEVTLVKKDQTLLQAHIEAALSLDGSFCRLAMFDITEQKRANAVLEARARLSEYALGHSLDELLTRTLDEAERLTGSTLGFFHFVAADQKTLSLQTCSTNTLRNMCRAEGKGWHYEADQAGVWADALRDRCPMIHNDYASLPHRKGLPPGHAPVLRELVVPVLRHERVVALLGVANKPGNYGPEDVQSVSQLANQVWDVVLVKRAEEEVQRQASLIRSLLDSLPDIVFFKNTEGVYLGANPAFVELVSRPRNEIIGKTDHDLFDQVMADSFREQDQQMLALRQPRHNEEWVTYPDGRKTLLDTLKTPYWSSDGELIGVLGISRDITERKRFENALHAALAEKTTLLKEVHHRVKNNLQIVSSLLNLQAGQVQDATVLELLSTTRNRVGAMALLHENLYQSENLAQLNLPAYVESLCAQLLRAAGPIEGRVRLERQVEPETISLTLDQAVPCGLLLNELVTNALKHAFPGDRHGRIQVKLEGPTPHTVRLTVADDGIGLPATLEPDRVESLGLRLVFMLTKQLHGTVTFERGLGTAIQIHFPSPAKTEPPNE